MSYRGQCNHLKLKPLPAYDSATSTSCRKCGAKLKQGKLSRGIKCSINLSAADYWSNSQPQTKEEASKRNPQTPWRFHWLLAFNQSRFASLASTVCFLKRVRQTSESPPWQNEYFFAHALNQTFLLKEIATGLFPSLTSHASPCQKSTVKAWLHCKLAYPHTALLYSKANRIPHK